jgi:endonuclease/exonuclease/phosphatase (EEP) superfamily protein YafD
MVRKIIGILLDLALWGLVALAFTCCFARLSPLVDLFTHFQLQYAMASSGLLFVLICLRARLWKMALAFFLCFLFTVPVAALKLERHIARSERFEDITILQYNVEFSNPGAEEIVKWVNDSTAGPLPDIVVLQEINLKMAPKYAALEKTYPYHLLAPRAGGFGTMIFSRVPVRSQSREHFPGESNEYSRMSLVTLAQGIPFTLTELHAFWPIGSESAKRHSAELRYVADLVSHGTQEHKILVGDLNITPYSPWFRDMKNRSGLTTAMQGRGISGTWPSFLPAPLRIPIDHLLVSDGIEVLERRVEKDLGSDHLPVVTKLRIYATN